MSINRCERSPWNAGYKKISLYDHQLDLSYSMMVWYPTQNEETLQQIGPYPISAAIGAQADTTSRYPAVLISHGSGGSPLVYRELARYLARQGWVVGVPEHPFNNRDNNTWEGTELNLLHRPRHLSIASDGLFGDPALSQVLQKNRYSIIGHSMGGYTALALAGGQPSSFPHESSSGCTSRLAVTTDARIASLVLLAPAAVWFSQEGALETLELPILMLTAEKDPFTPPYHAELIKRQLKSPEKLEHIQVTNAGHFSFLSPFPASMKREGFLPSTDPEGFDRTSFHLEMNDKIAAFLSVHH